MNFCGVVGTWLYAGAADAVVVDSWVAAGADDDAKDVSAEPDMSNDWSN